MIDGDQDGLGVLVPLGVRDLAGQAQVHLGLRVRDDVPDQQLAAATALVQDQHSRVTEDGREPERVQALAGAVPEVRDGRAVGDPDDP
jgi:hypothetical protein